MDEWQRNEVRNEVRSRDRNEWIETTSARFARVDGLDQFVCECSFRDCLSVISLTHVEYEAVRSDGGRFAIALNHENPEIDRVVAEHRRYAIVEKWMGEPRSMARAADPRHRSPITKGHDASTSR